jgi:fructokinase
LPVDNSSGSIEGERKLLKMKSEEPASSIHSAFTVVGLGELIWDFLPDGKQLGGAPTNFAYISRLLGHRAVVASRIGADALGREALERLERLGISTSYLQHDPIHPTGTVGVLIDERGEPHFTVNQNSAWDYLEWNEGWDELAQETEAVCFGTLGQREGQARETIIRFLKATRPDAVRIFDVNLRHSFFTTEMLSRSLELATVVKLNRDELSMAAGMLGFDEQEEEALGRRLIARFRLELVAVTRGAQGSLLVTSEEAVSHPGFPVQVKDTIGAGDAFTAALAHCYLRRAPLKTISEAANRSGAWVATQSGATPEAQPQLLEQMLGDLDIPR